MGRLQSGYTMNRLGEIHLSGLSSALSKMVEYSGSTVSHQQRAAVAKQVSTAGDQLMSRLSDQLLDYLKRLDNAADRRITNVVGHNFLTKAQEELSRVAEDVSFGVYDGTKIWPSPTSGGTNSINNSPGAIIQSGDGVIDQINLGSFRDLVDEVEKEVASMPLQDPDRDEIRDLIEAAKGELAKPRPDEGRIRRWLGRISSFAEKVGASVLAEVIRRGLLG